jgi:hypothetical protein
LSYPASFVGITSALPGIQYSLQGNVLNVIWVDQSTNGNGYQVFSGQNLLELNFSIKSPFTVVQKESFIAGQVSGLKEMAPSPTPRSKIDSSTQWINISNLTEVEVSSSATNIEVNIIDMMGRIISKQSINIHDASKMELPTSLNFGVYLLQVYDGFFTQTNKVVLPKKE